MRAVELFVSVFLESIFYVGGGLSIIGIRPKFYKIVYMSILYALVAFIVRMVYETFEIPLGTHSFMLIVSLILIMTFVGKQKWSGAIIATLVSFLLMTLGEGLIMYNVADYFNITSYNILHKPGCRLLGIILSNTFLIIVFILGYVFKFSIIDLNSLSKDEEVK